MCVCMLHAASHQITTSKKPTAVRNLHQHPGRIPMRMPIPFKMMSKTNQLQTIGDNKDISHVYMNDIHSIPSHTPHMHDERVSQDHRNMYIEKTGDNTQKKNRYH